LSVPLLGAGLGLSEGERDRLVDCRMASVLSPDSSRSALITVLAESVIDLRSGASTHRRRDSFVMTGRA